MSKAIVTIVGNLGRDPELSTTPSGTSICKFSVAVNDRIGSGDNAKELTTWYRVAAFGKQGESAAKNLVKGRQVQVTGRLVQDTYTKDGVERTSLEVNAFDITFVGSKPDSEQAGGGSAPASGSKKSGGSKPAPGDIEDDEIPF